ncbi:MAG TPA: GTP-binding protein [Herbaspirillum sp.]|jgi:cobalamin biosynthesis protein CobW
MIQPIPVTIVTGFLGSGKTTLLAGLVKGRKTRRLALLINEFGEVSVDGALIRASAEAGAGNDPGAGDLPQVRIDELSHGLIAYGDDDLFLPAMRAIAARRANIDHVLIETSGLALPSAAMALLQGPLADTFVLDATLAVVDTPLLLAGRFDAGDAAASAAATTAAAAAALFEQQLALADVVVLNKIDALDDAALLRAEELVRTRAPSVRFLELAYRAQLDMRVALGLRLHQVGRNAPAAPHAHGIAYTPLADAGDALNGHAHSGIGAHSHGLATHRHFHRQDAGWLSFTLRSDAMQPLPQLRQALAQAARLEPILRSKGFVCAAGRSQPVLVQGVRERVVLAGQDDAGKNIAGDAIEDAANDASDKAPAAILDGGLTVPQRSELVFIGYHASRARVAGLLSTLTATHWS